MVELVGSVNLDTIRAAHERIRPYIHRTPVLTNSWLNDACRASLFFKCENFQKVGAFKARGATNAVFALDDETARRGVATHSSGNHGAAVARAAKLRGIPAHIVMPSNSAKVKIRAVESYGAQVVFCEPTEESREIKCAEVINQTGATLIHSFENEHVIAGQGTAAMELLEDIADLDVIMCPVGGGGLLSGTAIAAKSMRPQIKVIAVEPENADDAAQSFRAGRRLVTEKKFTDCRWTAHKYWRTEFRDRSTLCGRHRDRQRRSDRFGDAHDLGNDEDHNRAFSGRSLCGDCRRRN